MVDPAPLRYSHAAAGLVFALRVGGRRLNSHRRITIGARLSDATSVALVANVS